MLTTCNCLGIFAGCSGIPDFKECNKTELLTDEQINENKANEVRELFTAYIEDDNSSTKPSKKTTLDNSLKNYTAKKNFTVTFYYDESKYYKVDGEASTDDVKTGVHFFIVKGEKDKPLTYIEKIGTKKDTKNSK